MSRTIILSYTIFSAITIFSCYAAEEDMLSQASRMAQEKNPQNTKVVQAFALRLSKETCYVAQKFQDDSHRTDTFRKEDMTSLTLSESNTTQTQFNHMAMLKIKAELGLICSDPQYVAYKDLQQSSVS